MYSFHRIPFYHMDAENIIRNNLCDTAVLLSYNAQEVFGLPAFLFQVCNDHA